MTTIEKYIWIVNALYCTGERGMSLKELNDKWMRDINVSNGEPLPRQTFDRWKGNILMAFGVNIECNMKGGYRYYITNPESLSNGEIVRWFFRCIFHNQHIVTKSSTEESNSSGRDTIQS